MSRWKKDALFSKYFDNSEKYIKEAGICTNVVNVEIPE